MISAARLPNFAASKATIEYLIILPQNTEMAKRILPVFSTPAARITSFVGNGGGASTAPNTAHAPYTRIFCSIRATRSGLKRARALSPPLRPMP